MNGIMLNQANNNMEGISNQKLSFVNFNQKVIQKDFHQHLLKANEYSNYNNNQWQNRANNQYQNYSDTNQYNEYNNFNKDYQINQQNNYNEFKVDDPYNNINIRDDFKIDQNQEKYDLTEKLDKIKDKIEKLRDNNQEANNLEKLNTKKNDSDKNASELNKITNKSIDENKKKINDSKSKESKTDPSELQFQQIANLLDLLAKEVQGEKSLNNKEWKNALLQLNKLNKDLMNNNVLKNDKASKELQSIFKQIKDFLSSNQVKTQSENGELVSSDKLTANKKEMISDILKDIQALLEKHVQDKIENKPLLNSNKITKVQQEILPQQGIQLVKLNKKAQKAEAIKENIQKEVIENQGVQQKGEVKVSNSSETHGENSSSLGFSQGKSNINNYNLKVPKGLNVNNPAELFDQIVNKATMVLNNKRSEMQIKLEPNFLGNVRLKVVVEGKEVSGSFFVENQMVKNFLEDNMSTLKANLENQGLQFEKINIFLDNGRERELNAQSDREFNQNYFNGTQINQSNLAMDEENLISQYITPDWLAKEVDLVI